jgi:hypothetical protein
VVGRCERVGFAVIVGETEGIGDVVALVEARATFCCGIIRHNKKD